jgi:hypothetical protein
MAPASGASLRHRHRRHRSYYKRITFARQTKVIAEKPQPQRLHMDFGFMALFPYA